MSRSDDVLDAMTPDLYEAAADASRWPLVWEQIGQALGASSGTLYCDCGATDETFVAMPGWSDEAIRLYAEHFGAVDPYVVRSESLPVSRILLGPEMVPEQLYVES